MEGLYVKKRKSKKGDPWTRSLGIMEEDGRIHFLVLEVDGECCGCGNSFLPTSREIPMSKVKV